MTTIRIYAAGAVSDIAGPAGWDGTTGYPTAYVASLGVKIIGLSGTTAQRPAPGGASRALEGLWYFDTDVSRMLVCDGKAWRDPLTGPTYKAAPQSQTRCLVPISAGLRKDSGGTGANPSGYSAAAGSFCDWLDSDLAILRKVPTGTETALSVTTAAGVGGWLSPCGVGRTADRATWLAGPIGSALVSAALLYPVFCDVQIGKVVFFEFASSTWRDPATGGAA